LIPSPARAPPHIARPRAKTGINAGHLMARYMVVERFKDADAAG
jgi:hypothetical protein